MGWNLMVPTTGLEAQWPIQAATPNAIVLPPASPGAAPWGSLASRQPVVPASSVRPAIEISEYVLSTLFGGEYSAFADRDSSCTGS